MPLQTAMQRGTGQMRDRCLQSVEAIIKRAAEYSCGKQR
jgi:hypothetical protein